MGRGASGKYIVVSKKENLPPSSSSSDYEDNDYIKEHKPKVIKSQKALEVLCEPDSIKLLSNFQILREEDQQYFYFMFNVVPPESNGAEIFAYNLYQSDTKLPYADNKIKL